MFKNEQDFNPFETALDKLRGGAQLEFWRRYKKLDSKILAQIPYTTGDLENAFQHAYTAALYANLGLGKHVHFWDI